LEGRANVAVNEQQKYFVVDNMVKGFSLHSLDNGSWKRSFAINKTSSKLTSLLPRQVAFVEGSGAIAGGSDHGAAYVFDRRTASILQVLHHGSRDIVQTVTVSDFLL
jgi:hypothetical protein